MSTRESRRRKWIMVYLGIAALVWAGGPIALALVLT
jgi:hypothetical protein